jgi:hypothetical protein
VTTQKWGGLASFILVGIFAVAPVIYLVALPAATGLALTDFGDPFKLRPVLANPVFDLGDFLFGPVWGTSLIVAVFALREYFGESAPRRMLLALLAAGLSAGLFVGGASIQTIGRHYTALHSELDVATYEAIFRASSIVVPGLTSAGRHFLGWSLIMVGSAGLTTKRLPRLLCVFYLVGGFPSLVAYLFPGLGEVVLILGLVWGIWEGIILWRAGSGEMAAGSA